MKQFRVPFALLALVAAGSIACAAQARAVGRSGSFLGDGAPLQALLADISTAIHPAAAHQVRIEQHFSIRVMPGGPMMSPDALVELHEDRQDEDEPRYAERKMGQCVAWSGIAAVQGSTENRLLFFMRDRHIVSAELEKACQARDFYSGFLFERTRDGRICARRDVLQARSGANCRIKRLRELVEVPDRR